MKRWKGFGRGLFIAGVLALLMGQTAFAEAGGNETHYTYTVTLYSGKQGDFSSAGGIQVDNHKTGSGYQISQPEQGGDRIRITGLQYGDMVTVNPQACASLNGDSKYYVSGIRESGLDNNTSSASAFSVESDREYVIAYGIKGDMVSYVVNYQDADGNSLADSQTFYGTVGDSPVVAFYYIENYQPQAYNLTKTLSSNEAENVFTFIYREVSGENGRTPQNGETDAADDGTPGTADGAADGTDGTADGTGGAGPGTPDADAADGNEGDNLVNSEDEETPQDLVNLDDEETPLANIKETSARPAGNMLVFIGTGTAAALGLTALTIAAIRKRKTKTCKVEKESGTETKKEEENSSHL